MSRLDVIKEKNRFYDKVVFRFGWHYRSGYRRSVNCLFTAKHNYLILAWYFCYCNTDDNLHLRI